MHFGVKHLAVVFHAKLEADKAVSRANVAYTVDDFAIWLRDAPELGVMAWRVVIDQTGDERVPRQCWIIHNGPSIGRIGDLCGDQALPIVRPRASKTGWGIEPVRTSPDGPQSRLLPR